MVCEISNWWPKPVGPQPVGLQPVGSQIVGDVQFTLNLTNRDTNLHEFLLSLGFCVFDYQILLVRLALQLDGAVARQHALFNCGAHKANISAYIFWA